MSIAEIRALADQVRQSLNLTEPYIQIVHLLENVIPQVEGLDDFYVEVCEMEELGEKHAETFPQSNLIRVRRDVYERACNGEGRDRATLAHEFGHYLMHQGVALARSDVEPPPWQDSEWQANCFAGEFLVSYRHVGLCESYIEAARLFGVSLACAKYQWDRFKKEGLTVRG